MCVHAPKSCTDVLFDQKSHLFWHEVSRADETTSSYSGGQQEPVQPRHQPHTAAVWSPGPPHGDWANMNTTFVIIKQKDDWLKEAESCLWCSGNQWEGQTVWDLREEPGRLSRSLRVSGPGAALLSRRILQSHYWDPAGKYSIYTEIWPRSSFYINMLYYLYIIYLCL